eukprot:3535742-Pyramimonas_sp.AAC.1
MVRKRPRSLSPEIAAAVKRPPRAAAGLHIRPVAPSAKQAATKRAVHEKAGAKSAAPEIIDLS